MTATLRSTTPPELGLGGRRLVIDCRHGTTYVDQFIPSTVPGGAGSRRSPKRRQVTPADSVPMSRR
jgi:hypothetical protein